jgi:hypothetical protein
MVPGTAGARQDVSLAAPSNGRRLMSADGWPPPSASPVAPDAASSVRIIGGFDLSLRLDEAAAPAPPRGGPGPLEFSSGGLCGFQWRPTLPAAVYFSATRSRYQSARVGRRYGRHLLQSLPSSVYFLFAMLDTMPG